MSSKRSKLSKDVAIVGVGNSKFGKRDDASLRELAFEAVKECIEDAGVSLDDIEGMAAGIASEEFSCALQPSAQIHDYLEFNPKSNFRLEGACASGSLAIRTGWMTIASGLADLFLAVGVEKMFEINTSEATEIMGKAGDAIWEYPFGMTFPGYYAMIAQAHMANYGTTEEQLAMVAVKNHHYGMMNPIAHMRKEITLEDAMGSFMIAHPLKLYDCCLITDGAAAVLLASEEKVKEFSKEPIWIVGMGCGTSPQITKRKDLTTIDGTVIASKQAYEMAEVEPKDIDIACVHDCFTIAEICAYEDLGFCRKGEGGKFIEEKQSYIEGKIPVNVDGGLKSKGHPVGATGVSMSVEITKQLRGEVNKRQVKGAKTGLTHNVGGSGQIVTVHIYRRD